MDLSEAFDCLAHGLVVKKLEGTVLTKIHAVFCVVTWKTAHKVSKKVKSAAQAAFWPKGSPKEVSLDQKSSTVL